MAAFALAVFQPSTISPPDWSLGRVLAFARGYLPIGCVKGSERQEPPQRGK